MIDVTSEGCCHFDNEFNSGETITINGSILPRKDNDIRLNKRLWGKCQWLRTEYELEAL